MALVLGIAGGLARLGIVVAPATAGEFHGALMISGFFGTLIAIERAVADGRAAALLVPVVSVLGLIFSLSGFELAGAGAFLAAGFGLTLLTFLAALRLPTLFTAVMTAGAAFWAIGSGLWLQGASIADVTYIWLGFLVLTIVAERIELSRLMMASGPAKAALLLFIALFAVALLRGEPWQGSLLLAVSLGAIALWLLGNDIARRTIFSRGLARYSAASLLLGYFWLLVSAFSLALAPPGIAAMGHDAAVHAIALGFVLSMVFAHAPIILPAVLGAPVRYTAALYVPTLLLEASVAVRLFADFSERVELLPVSAWTTVASMVLYGLILASTAATVAGRGRGGGRVRT